MWTMYPFFHPDRSRFFNMATLYTKIWRGLQNGLEMQLRLPSSITNIERIVDESYVRWEATGGVDLQLPSFKLTNRQMLWVCLAHTMAIKTHENLAIYQNSTVNEHVLNGILKMHPNFREAFQCDKNTNINDAWYLYENKYGQKGPPIRQPPSNGEPTD